MSVRMKRMNGRRQGVKEITWVERPLPSKSSRAALVASRRGPPRPGISGSEFKSKDTYTGALVADTTGAVVLLNGLARGADIADRDGREVLMRSIQINGVNNVTSGTGLDQTHRVLLVYDRQANAAAPTGAMILDTTAANVTLCVRNLENRKRFTILMDKVFRLNANDEPGGGVAWRFYRRLRHPVTFNAGNAGTIADITTGSLYLISLGSLAAGVTAGSCVANCRMRYEDK